MMADDSMDAEDIYTVIPTAPEDIPPFDSSLEQSSPLPATGNKMAPRPPSLTFTGRPSNGATPPAPYDKNGGVPHQRPVHKQPREGGRKKDGK